MGPRLRLLTASLVFGGGILNCGRAQEIQVEDVPAVDAQADRLMRQMSEYLMALDGFSFKAHSTWDDVHPHGEKVQYGTMLDVAIRRPDRIHALMHGDIHERRFWFDGQNITLLDLGENLYSTAPVPGRPTIDAALDFTMQQFGFTVPVADLLFADPYETLMADVQSGLYAGLNWVEGEKYHHLAFTGAHVDWQIWIESGNRVVPRKFVITYKDEPASPQYSVTFTDWDFSHPLPDMLFTFEPPAGAHEIEFVPVGNE